MEPFSKSTYQSLYQELVTYLMSCNRFTLDLYNLYYVLSCSSNFQVLKYIENSKLSFKWSNGDFDIFCNIELEQSELNYFINKRKTLGPIDRNDIERLISNCKFGINYEHCISSPTCKQIL
jgi:hypothetical protein